MNYSTQPAKLAHCDEFAQKLPDGWQTMIGENGSELSGGERQRIPSAQSIFNFICFLLRLFCTLPEQPTIRNETGSTHSAAKAILQSKKKRLNATSAVEIHAPISSGITWEETVSIVAQSAMIVLVRSDRSFLPKNESGIFLSFSASVMRLTPLST